MFTVNSDLWSIHIKRNASANLVEVKKKNVQTESVNTSKLWGCLTEIYTFRIKCGW